WMPPHIAPCSRRPVSAPWQSPLPPPAPPALPPPPLHCARSRHHARHPYLLFSFIREKKATMRFEKHRGLFSHLSHTHTHTHTHAHTHTRTHTHTHTHTHTPEHKHMHT